MSSSPFCPCKDTTCSFHPSNHDQGCNLCVEDSVKNREIPKCFFLRATDNIEDFTDWSFEAFAKLILTHRTEPEHSEEKPTLKTEEEPTQETEEEAVQEMEEEPAQEPEEEPEEKPEEHETSETLDEPIKSAAQEKSEKQPVQPMKNKQYKRHYRLLRTPF